jgi:hypothetical protein
VEEAEHDPATDTETAWQQGREKVPDESLTVAAKQTSVWSIHLGRGIKQLSALATKKRPQ